MVILLALTVSAKRIVKLLSRILKCIRIAVCKERILDISGHPPDVGNKALNILLLVLLCAEQEVLQTGDRALTLCHVVVVAVL